MIRSAIKKDAVSWAAISYTYSPVYNYALLTAVTYVNVGDADGGGQNITESYTYDFYTGAKRSTTDGNGHTTYYEYDKAERLLKETLPDGLCRTYVYDDANNILTKTDANGNSVVNYYDPFGKLSSVIEKSTGTVLTRKKYDARNNLSAETDANGNSIEYTYDKINRLTSTTVHDTSGKMMSKTLVDYYENFTDIYGNTCLKVTVTTVGDTTNLVSNSYYDSRGRLAKNGRVSDSGEDFSYIEYDYLSNTISKTGFDGAKTLYEYNGVGRLLKSTDALGNTTKCSYDGLGNVTSTVNALGNTAYSSYDSLGRQISQKTPQGDGVYAVTRYYYDGVGKLIKTIDPKGFITRNYYTDRGFLQAVEQVISSEQSNIVKYDYDGEGNMTAQYTGLSNWTDSVYAKRIYAYDQYGRLTSETDASGRVTRHRYDLNGNLISSTDRNGVISCSAYDGLNRVTKKYNSKDGESAALINKYGLNGSLLESSKAGGATSYTYDSLGQAVLIKYSSGISKEYTYDKAGRVASLTVKQGSVSEQTLSYGYDAVGRLTLLVSDGVRFTYEYTAVGQLRYETNGLTGISAEYAYYPSGTQKYLRNYKAGELINNFEYEYDLRGNQTKKDEDGVVTEYVYDALGRLKTAILPNDKMQDYEFDDYGNISKMVEMTYDYITNTTNFYDADNRILMSECKTTYETVQNYYEYDGEGNGTSSTKSTIRLLGTVTNKYEYYYNGENQLATVVDPGGVIYEYAYNVEGLRSKKTSGDETVHYIYEGGYIILETDADEAITARNVWGFRLLYRQAGDTQYGYIFNGHGDIIKLTDRNGNELEDYSYDPYGRQDGKEENGFSKTFRWEAETENNAVNNPFRYCGEYLDLETNFYYLRARYYDPTIGRFLSEDTHWNTSNAIYGDDPLMLNKYSAAPDIAAIMQSTNLYVYAMNNPIRWIDPSGKAVTDWDRNVMGGIPGRIERMQLITDNWNSGTPKQQAEWRAEVEGYRAQLRNEYECTDKNGITRSKKLAAKSNFIIMIM